MSQRKVALSLLFLSVVSAGCINLSGGSDGSVAVHSLSVSPSQIYEGTSTNVELNVRNVGNLPATVGIGEEGDNIMTNHCSDIFRKDSFSMTTSGDVEDEEENVIVLEEDRDISMQWRLDQEGTIPIYGQDCDLRFRVPFNYSVNSFKQVQVKESRDVDDDPGLHHESSAGPMSFAIETISNTPNPSVFVADQEEEMTILFQLQHHGRDGVDQGVVDIDEESLELRADEPIDFNFKGQGGEGDDHCDFDLEDDRLRMFEGESEVIQCVLPIPEDLGGDPGVTSNIYGSVNYSYVNHIGSRNIRVEPRG